MVPGQGEHPGTEDEAGLHLRAAVWNAGDACVESGFEGHILLSGPWRFTGSLQARRREQMELAKAVSTA